VHACECTIRTATQPPQPIEKSTAGASRIAQVVVAKTVDHLPLHRQEKIFEQHGADISRKTMGGWLAKSAEILDPLRWMRNWTSRVRGGSGRTAGMPSIR
jgi:transposase